MTVRRINRKVAADPAPGGRSPGPAPASNTPEGPGKRWVEPFSLYDIKLAKRNPKDHDIGAICASLERRGLGALPLLDERTGRLVAGHGRIEALRALHKQGKAAPQGVDTDGKEWFVPIVRGWASRNDADAEAYLIADNRLVELGGWEQAELAGMLEELADADHESLEATGYFLEDVQELVAEQAAAGVTESEANEVPADEAEAEPAEIYVRSGELWQLGPHRLLVGDTMKPQDIDRLLGGQEPHAVICDPPYAIYGSSTGIGADIADDKMVRPFFEALFRMCHRVLPFFAHVYTCTDWRSWSAVVDSAKRAELSLKNCIVWDKGGAGLGANWANAHEFIGFFSKLHAPKAMKSGIVTGQRTVHKPNILRFPRVSGDEREHNAAKPVGLMKEFVEAATEGGQNVLEPFCGSGSTLIACHQLGRVCFAMEIEPKWAQVTIERFKRVAGLEPKLLEEPPA